MKSNMLNLILAAAILTACENQPSGITVSGTIENGTNEKVTLLRYSAQKPDTLGRTTLDASGKFSFNVEPGRLSFYTVEVGNTPPVFLAFDSTSTGIVLTANLESIKQDYSVSGSADSEDIRNFFVEGNRFEQRLDSTMKAMQEAATFNDQDLRVALGNYYNSTRKAYRNYLVDHVQSKPSSVANYSILQRLDPVQDIELFRSVRDGLQGRMSGNYFFDALADRVAQAERQLEIQNFLAPGTPAPDIVLPNPDGQMVALSSLRGKYVLIDFWASWCKPCRMENPNVVKMYDKYKKREFEIFGVSLDRDRDKWLEAIRDDKLTWPQVSDLQFWSSAAAKLYNVQSIPFTVLLDPEGKVVQTNLRGAALEQKMAEIFGT